MTQLPNCLIDKIIMMNRHPLAEIFHDLYEPYRNALHIQQNSPDKVFREAGIPSFWEYLQRGIHCVEWGDVFFQRWEFEQRHAWLNSDFDLDEYRSTHGPDAMPRVYEKMDRIHQWQEERGLLELFIYRDISI